VNQRQGVLSLCRVILLIRGAATAGCQRPSLFDGASTRKLNREYEYEYSLVASSCTVGGRVWFPQLGGHLWAKETTGKEKRPTTENPKTACGVTYKAPVMSIPRPFLRIIGPETKTGLDAGLSTFHFHPTLHGLLGGIE